MMAKKFQQANVISSTVSLSRQDWLKIRRLGLGGSEIAAVSGMSRYSTPLKVYLDKTEGSETEMNEAMEMGIELEPTVAKLFTKRTGMKARNVNQVLQHPDYPWMLANLDRVVGSGADLAILECKTAGHFASGDWADGKIPESYEMQVMWYMAVTGIKKAYIAVLIAGQKFEWREIVYDQTAVDAMIKIGGEFWKLVEDRTPPSMDGSEIANEWLQKRFNSSTNTSIDLDSGAGFLLDQYQRSSEIIEQHEKIKATAKQNLEKLMGDNEIGRLPGGRVITWKPQTTNRFDSAQFKKDHPQMAEVYIKSSTTRVFRVK